MLAGAAGTALAAAFCRLGGVVAVAVGERVKTVLKPLSSYPGETMGSETVDEAEAVGEAGGGEE